MSSVFPQKCLALSSHHTSGSEVSGDDINTNKYHKNPCEIVFGHGVVRSFEGNLEGIISPSVGVPLSVLEHFHHRKEENGAGRGR